MKTVVIIVIAAALALGGCVPPTTHVGTQDLNHDRAIVEERTSGAEVLIDDDFRRKAAAKVQAEAKRYAGFTAAFPSTSAPPRLARTLSATGCSGARRSTNARSICMRA